MGATIHLKQKKKSNSGQLPFGGASGDCGTSDSCNLCYLEQLWCSSVLVVGGPGAGTGQAGRLVGPSLTIAMALLGTHAGHSALAQDKPSFFYPLLL